MYAVIKTGGKQYRVAQGDILRVEKLDAEAGDVVTFDQVLMIGGEGDPLVGAPGVDGASVTAEVLDERKDKKVIIFKKRRRQNYRRKRGHRQWITVISIAEILKPGAKSALGGKKKSGQAGG